MAQVKVAIRREAPAGNCQNGALKFKHLILEALISKRLSVMVKTHLENIVAMQLRELVTKILMELIFSSEFMQKFEEIKTSRAVPPAEKNLSDSLPLEQLQLKFEPEEIPLLYSTISISDQLDHPIKVALMNESREVVDEGNEASAMLELLVLSADSRDKVITQEEFRKAELKPRENKPAILHGETRIQLVNGRGMVDPSLCFTDNSSWMKTNMFCLGLVPLSTQSRIQGAKTRAFRVKDRRSKGNQKHENPDSSSSIWGLPGVSKHGRYYSEFEKMKIYTVGDFLGRLESNPEEIRKIFNREKDFEALVKLTKKCTTNTTKEILVRADLNQQKHSADNHNLNLVGSSSDKSLIARGKTYPAGQTEVLPNCSLTEAPSQSILRGGRGQSCDQFQNQFDGQDRSSTQAMLPDSNIQKERLDSDGQGRVMIISEVDPEKGEELEAQRDRNQPRNISGMSNRLDMLGSCSTSSILRPLRPIIYSAGLSGEPPIHLPADASDSRSTKRARGQTYDHDRPSNPEASAMPGLPMPNNSHNAHYPEACSSAVVVPNSNIIESEDLGCRIETIAELESFLMNDSICFLD